MMKFKLTLAALIIAPLMLTACAKKEEKSSADQQAAATSSIQTSPEQQAAIDAIDKPNMDERNTDIVVSEDDHAEHAASEAH